MYKYKEEWRKRKTNRGMKRWEVKRKGGGGGEGQKPSDDSVALKLTLTASFSFTKPLLRACSDFHHKHRQGFFFGKLQKQQEAAGYKCVQRSFQSCVICSSLSFFTLFLSFFEFRVAINHEPTTTATRVRQTLKGLKAKMQ